MDKGKVKNKHFTETNVLLGLTIVLLGFTIWAIVGAESFIGKCVNNVPPENCNAPAGDFAVEPDSGSNIILGGCGPKENQKCIFTGIPSLSSAIRKCNSLGNKCNRFTYDNKTMAVVSLTGKVLNTRGKHMYTRQNGVTYRSSAKNSKTYQNRNLQGTTTSVSNFTYTPIFSTSSSGTTATGSGY